MLEIRRSVLIGIVNQAIEAGQPALKQWLRHNPESDTMVNYKTSCLRDVAKHARGVDYGAFHCQYGCPVEQAGLQGMYGFWFTMCYDRLMDQHLETPTGSLTQGWPVKVIEDDATNALS